MAITFSTGMTEKTSLVDADRTMIGDSADSDIAKYAKQSTIDTKTLSAITDQSEKESIVDADEVIINDSEDSYNPKKIEAELLRYPPGHYASEGLYVSGTDVRISDYTFEVDGKVYKGSDSVVVDITILTGSVWYAFTLKEDTGTISRKRVGATGSWDNWTTSGNQLNLLSIYDQEKNCVRDSIAGEYFRILGVGLANSTPDDFDYLENTLNKPLTYIECSNTTNQSIPNATNTIVDFDDILIDTNSEVTTGSSWKFEPKSRKKCGVETSFSYSSATWPAGSSINLFLSFDNGTTINRRLDKLTVGLAETTPVAKRVSGNYTKTFGVNDDVSIVTNHAQGSALTISGTSIEFNSLVISELKD